MSAQYASVGNHSPVSVAGAHEPVSPVSPVSPVESPWEESREPLPDSPSHRVSYVSGPARTPILVSNNHEKALVHSSASPLGSPLVDIPISHGWRPTYLRRRVIGAFAVLILIAIAAIEGLDRVSSRNNGLVDADTRLYYLWTFGPTTVLTLLLAAWTRVEFQAGRYTPWMVLRIGQTGGKPIDWRRNDVSRTLLVDYPGTFAPKALFLAIRNRHGLVAAAMLIKLLLQLQIVLATGLLGIQQFTVLQEGQPVHLTDAFDEGNITRTSTTLDTRPFYIMSGISMLNLSYPDGSVPGFSYQKFDAKTALDLAPNATQVTVPVRGFSVSMTCEQPKTTFNWINDELLRGGAQQGELALPNSFCTGISWVNNFGYPPQAGYHWLTMSLYPNSSDVTTNTQNCTRPLVAAAVMSKKLNSTGGVEFVAASSVVCEIQGEFSDVLVTQPKFGLPTLTVASGSRNNTLGGDFLDLVWSSIPQPEGAGVPPPHFSGEDYVSDGYLPPPFRIGTNLLPGGPPPVSKLLDSATLESAIRLYYQGIGPVAVDYHLRNETQATVSGTTMSVVTRLVVHTSTAQAMVGVFCCAVLLAIPIFVHAAPKNGFVPRSPDTLAGAGVLLAYSDDLLSRLRGLGSASLLAVGKRLQGSYYTTLVQSADKAADSVFVVKRVDRSGHDTTTDGAPPPTPPTERKQPHWYNPWSLRPENKIGGIIFTSALIIALAILLKKSLQHDGLVDAPVGDAYHYLWTSLPTIFFVILSLYLGSCDYQIRSLAPLAGLARRPVTFEKGLAVSYIDDIPVVALIKALQNRCKPVAVAKTIVLLCAFLPILASSLFSLSTVTTTAIVDLEQTTFLASGSVTNNGWDAPYLTGDLILNANLSYPASTYGDMVFPDLSVKDTDLASLSPNLSIAATVPAIRPRLTCDFSSQVGPNVSSVTIFSGGHNWTCAISNSCGGQKPDYFGYLASECVASIGFIDLTGPMGNLPLTTYVWGGCSNNTNSSASAPKKVVSYAAVLACNETFEQVQVQTTFRGPNMTISPDQPPTAVASSATPYNISIGAPQLYSYLAINTPQDFTNIIDPFFQTLLAPTSLLRVPPSWLVSRARSEDVIGAIKTQHLLLRAQSLHGAKGSRVAYTTGAAATASHASASTSNSTSDSTSSTASSQPQSQPPNAIKATLTHPQARLLQLPIPTLTLLALLAAILLLDLISFLQTERHGYRRLVPRAPGSIAATAALLADAEVFRPGGDLPPEGGGEVQRLSDSALAAWYGGAVFRLGWGRRTPSGDGAAAVEGGQEGRRVSEGESFTIRMVQAEDAVWTSGAAARSRTWRVQSWGSFFGVSSLLSRRRR